MDSDRKALGRRDDRDGERKPCDRDRKPFGRRDDRDGERKPIGRVGKH